MIVTRLCGVHLVATSWMEACALNVCFAVCTDLCVYKFLPPMCDMSKASTCSYLGVQLYIVDCLLLMWLLSHDELVTESFKPENSSPT